MPSISVICFPFPPSTSRLMTVCRLDRSLPAACMDRLHICTVWASVPHRAAVSVQLFALAAVSLISAHISATALLTVSIMLLKTPSMAPLTVSPTLLTFSSALAKLSVAVTPVFAAVFTAFRSVAFCSRVPLTSCSWLFMSARADRALFSFCSYLATASSLSPYFSFTSSRAARQAFTTFSCSAICAFRLLAFTSAFCWAVALLPSSFVSACSSLFSVFRFRLALLIVLEYSFSPSSTILLLISFSATFSPPYKPSLRFAFPQFTRTSCFALITYISMMNPGVRCRASFSPIPAINAYPRYSLTRVDRRPSRFLLLSPSDTRRKPRRPLRSRPSSLISCLPPSQR